MNGEQVTRRAATAEPVVVEVTVRVEFVVKGDVVGGAADQVEHDAGDRSWCRCI